MSGSSDSDKWDQQCDHVSGQMLDHLKPFVTPISEVISHDHGELWGSGSFFEYNDRRFVITNEHVSKKLEERSLAHQFCGSDAVVRFMTPFVARIPPIDVAISEVTDEVWNLKQHSASPIPISRFADRHAPMDGELLFMVGHSAERSGFHFGTLHSHGTPYLTRECEIPEDHKHPDIHFALPYNPELARPIEPGARGLPAPPGLSGSLVWNTRYVDALAKGEEWSPERAVVTGIVFLWRPDVASLLAVRVENFGLTEMCENHAEANKRLDTNA